jgi:hypothetical protein
VAGRVIKWIEEWLKWDNNYKRSTEPTRATTRGVENIAKP